MTRDEIIRMAQDAGFHVGNDSYGAYADFPGEGKSLTALERFAELAAASEREACAKVCEEATNSTNCHMIGYGFAEAIRNRK